MNPPEQEEVLQEQKEKKKTCWRKRSDVESDSERPSSSECECQLLNTLMMKSLQEHDVIPFKCNETDTKIHICVIFKCDHRHTQWM